MPKSDALINRFVRWISELLDGKPSTNFIQIELTPEAEKALTDLQNKVGANSIPETIKEAIGFYQWFADKNSDGCKLAIIKDGKIETVEIKMANRN